MVKPNPMPSPSKREDNGPCLEAKASARPKTMQFTTISGMNKPNVAYNAGTYACITI